MSSKYKPRTTNHWPPVTLQRGFTFTEILIALALILILLIGVSQVFTITSKTIGTGQSLSVAMRGQKAVGQALQNDITGYAASTGNVQDLGNTALRSGMRPMAPDDLTERAPFLIISNIRVPTFLTAQDEKNMLVTPSDTNWVTRSQEIRTIDGTSSYVPLFSYGERNFRVDTVNFFIRGDFTRQTSNSGTIVPDSVSSNDAWVYYGHGRIFTGVNPASIDEIGNGYANPGIDQTSGGQENRNNRFASQFLLSRMQMLLIQTKDPDDGSSGSLPMGVYSDLGTPMYHIYSNWVYNNSNGSTQPRRTSKSPFSTQTFVIREGAVQQPSTSPPSPDWISQYTDEPSPSVSSGDALRLDHARTDIAGVGRQEAMEQIERVALNTAQVPFWHDGIMGTNTSTRFAVNPFPTRPFNAKKAGQRSQILTDSCSQFIVEYAGDFIAQTATGTLDTTAANGGQSPDGTIDFVIDSDNIRQVRWYGMPRDVDGDGKIAGRNNNNRFTSPDVVPLRDIRGAMAPFEKITLDNSYVGGIYLQASTEQYYMDVSNGIGTTEYAQGTNTFNNIVDGSEYLCAWSPLDMDKTSATYAGVPSMLRFIVELRDPAGRLKDPTIQEFIFAIPTE